MAGRIAYVMSRFPRLTETFIVREMDALRERGWDIQVYPLVLEHPRIVQPAARAWLPRVERVPFMSPGVLAANSRAWLAHPQAYGALFGRAVAENRTSLKFLSRALALFPKAVYTARRMQEQGVQHIHAHFATHPALQAWLIHHLTGIPYSVTVHAHDIFVRQEMLALKLKDAAFIVAISEFNRERVARIAGPELRARTHVVHCGIVPSEYTVHACVPHDRVPQARFEIASVGALEPYKGFPFLVQACARLRELGVPVHCRIVGGGPERTRLQELIVENGLEGVVELLGPQPHELVARLLPEVDCYVQPSIVTPTGKMEGLPVAVIEALACALPVVASDLSGIPELVRTGKTGWLVPPADAAALARALADVYANPERANALAHAGRAQVLAEFDLESNVARLSELFAQVVTPSHTVPHSFYI